jgi:hypothetical protein
MHFPPPTASIRTALFKKRQEWWSDHTFAPVMNLRYSLHLCDSRTENCGMAQRFTSLRLSTLQVLKAKTNCRQRGSCFVAEFRHRAVVPRAWIWETVNRPKE